MNDLFEQEIVIAGEGTPDQERPLYSSVLPGRPAADSQEDRNNSKYELIAVAGGIAGLLALVVVTIQAVKK